MNRLYDLHSHSTASDGIFTPSELVQRAYQKGVQVLALTDHDSIAGLNEAQFEADKIGLQLVNGVEISTLWEGHTIHIVALGFDKNHKSIELLLTKQAQLRLQRAIKIGERLTKIGVLNGFESASKLTRGEVTRAHYARYLVQIGKVANEQQAFKKYLGQGKSCYVKAEWVSIAEAIEVIHQAGGQAVLAHPLKYDLSTSWIRRLIYDFKTWNGDGLEVAGCGQTISQRQQLAKWSQEFELLASPGSDFHFPCAWIELGGSLNLPEQCKPIWQDWR